MSNKRRNRQIKRMVRQETHDYNKLDEQGNIVPVFTISPDVETIPPSPRLGNQESSQEGDPIKPANSVDVVNLESYLEPQRTSSVDERRYERYSHILILLAFLDLPLLILPIIGEYTQFGKGAFVVMIVLGLILWIVLSICVYISHSHPDLSVWLTLLASISFAVALMGLTSLVPPLAILLPIVTHALTLFATAFLIRFKIYNKKLRIGLGAVLELTSLLSMFDWKTGAPAVIAFAILEFAEICSLVLIENTLSMSENWKSWMSSLYIAPLNAVMGRIDRM